MTLRQVHLAPYCYILFVIHGLIALMKAYTIMHINITIVDFTIIIPNVFGFKLLSQNSNDSFYAFQMLSGI